MAVVQVWTGPRAEAGAYALGPLAAHTSATIASALTGNQPTEFTMPRDVATEAGIAEGRFLWIDHPEDGVLERIILTVEDGSGSASSSVRITAAPLSFALGLRGTIRTINATGEVTNSFTLDALRVDTIMGLHFTPNRDLDNVLWASFGYSEYGGTIQIGPIAQWTYQKLLDEIERATGYEWDWVNLGADGYQLNLIPRLGADVDEPVLEVGKNIDRLQRVRDLMAGSTVVEPRDTSGAPMRDVWLTVQNISGSGPYWVQLVDPAGGPAVIREDGQFIGAFVRPLDGLAVEITDSRRSDSSVLLADRTGLLVGGLAALWATADGAYLDHVSSPTGLVARNRVVQPVEVPAPSLYANLLVDPSLKGALALWEVVNPSGGGADVFNRTDDRSPTMRINGAVSSGASSIGVDGADADLPVRFGDAMTVEGLDAIASTTTNTTAAGKATVPLTVVLPSSIGANVQLAWTRNGVVVGTAVTDGVQALSAPNLTLQNLPATPALTNGDQLIYTFQPGTRFVQGSNTLDITIPNGTSVVVVDTYLVNTLTPNGPSIRTVVLTWTSTLTATGNIGDPGLSLDLTNEPATPVGGLQQSREVSYTPPSVTYTFTLTGGPPAWSTAFVSTPTLTGATGVTVPANAVLAWVRAGVNLGTVRCVPGATSVATTIQVTLTSGYGQVLANDVFSLPSQTLYAASQQFLDATGAGNIPLRVNTTAAIADNALVTIRRCQDLNDAEFGSPVVLRLRGDRATAPTTYRGTGYSLYSPVMRVQSPNPALNSGGYSVLFGVGLTRWAAEASQAQRGWMCVWDADTGAQITVVGLGAVTPAYSPVFSAETQSGPTALIGLSGPRRLRLSLHPGGGEVGDNIGGFTFLRYVAATVSLSGTELALVDGAGSNALLHRGQDVLEARSKTARYRVQMSALSGDDATPPLRLVKGQTVRLRDTALGIDDRLRVVHVTSALENANAVTAELQVLTPFLSENT